MTAYKKLCLNISNEFPHLKQEDIVKVIDEVKRAYGGHFHGKLFSSIMKDIRTVVLCQHPDKLRSVKQSKPVFTEMNALKKEKTPPSGKKAESTWQQCSSASGTSFKVRQGLEEECSICLVEFSAEMSYILDCGHNFHKQCIDRWVKDQGERTCPICRTIVLMREEFPHLRDTASPVQHLDKDFPYLSPPSARQ
ncbi:E3 ubiquitin-protein ligase DZIP3-like [Babylonia areolata]|uniref:E3 ubiquitin-protein ligase DZIP3-like n=1 Tax=Babylonia areolata TaxID=304850 RepID=UPI003FD58B33